MGQQQNNRSANQTDTSSQNNTTMPNDSKDKIYLQLHEQYAINNNANLSTIMTLVIALIGVIGYYGSVFIQTTNEFKGNLFDLYIPNQCQYFIEALILVYLASISILAVLFCLCTYQGIAQRKEQFIIHAIRMRYEIGVGKLLPKEYHPFDKKWFQPIQGLYGELVKIFIVVFVVLTAITVLQVHYGDSSKVNCCIIELSILFTILIVFVCGWYFWKHNESYNEIQEEYKTMNRQSPNATE